MSVLSRRFPCLSILALLSGLSLARSGQTPQDKPAAHQIRVRTGEVVVDVSVSDSGGKPVRGLTESDFEVYEDGLKQQIASFRSISGDALQQTASPLQGRDASVPPPEPGAVTPVYPHLISLVFDNVNTNRSDAVRAADAAKTYVEKSLRKDDQAAVFGIGFGVHVFQRFTGDRASLVRAIEQATAGNTKYPGDLSAEIRTALSTIPGEGFIPGVYTDEDKINKAYEATADDMFQLPVLQELRVLLFMQRIDQGMHGSRSLAGLLSIIEAQRVVPGRKAMVFLSSGFALPPTTGQSAGGTTEFRTITSAANNAGITIYSVDASGLRAEDPETERRSAVTAAMNSKMIIGPNTSMGLLSNAIGLNPLENLERLAEETGGYAVKNTSDFAGEMGKIGGYLQEYYVLTYIPTNAINDGRFRAISVKLKKPRFNLMARKGYYAFPDTDRLPLTVFEAELLEYVNAKASPSSFPVHVAGYSFPGRGALPTAALFVQFPLAKLKFEKVRDSKALLAQVEVMLLVKKSDGSIIHRMSRQYDLQSSQERLADMRARDFSFYRRVPLGPGDYTLEAAVRDRRTNSCSVKKTLLQMPPMDPAALLLSSIVLGKTSVITANDASENIFRMEDPLRLKDAGIVPDASSVYRKSQDKELTIFFRAADPNASGQITTVLEFTRDGKPGLKFQETLASDDEDGQVQFAKKVGLDQFEPGQYELRVTAGNGGSSASAVARFRIEP